MDRRPHHRALDDAAALERPRDRVTLSPSTRDQSPMYIEGAYCAWRPPIRSSTRGRGACTRSSSICRARSARFSSLAVSVRVTGAMCTRRRLQPAAQREHAGDVLLRFTEQAVPADRSRPLDVRGEGEPGVAAELPQQLP